MIRSPTCASMATSSMPTAGCRGLTPDCGAIADLTAPYPGLSRDTWGRGVARRPWLRGSLERAVPWKHLARGGVMDRRGVAAAGGPGLVMFALVGVVSFTSDDPGLYLDAIPQGV